MSDTRDILLELGAEELPPKALARMAHALADSMAAGLTEYGLSFDSVKPMATPRRLAVRITNVPAYQPDRDIERRGPALKIAFDGEGNPTKAAEGFARSCGVAVENLERQEEPDGGGYLIFRSTEVGEATASLLPDAAAKALAALPIPKRMRWGAGDAEFSRPVHWLVFLFGEEVVEAELLGLASGRTTYGHRFHHPGAIELASPSDYLEKLLTPGYVMADLEARREKIRADVTARAEALGATALIDSDLLDEVTALVEWPVAVAGSFEEQYLKLPDELLVATMQSHQKYFPLTESAEPGAALVPNFITISNIESRNEASVRAGNERVIRPRLSDAAFFFDADLKTSIDERQAALKNIVFQTKLGSVHDKTLRIARLAGHVAIAMGESPEVVKLVRRAGEICKFDLVTDMVGEFPELQGTMGREYALTLGEDALVAQGIGELYHPRFAGDDIPATSVGRAIAVADKLDTLVGIFGIGQPPTGDKDPYALRRAALGILRIIIEAELELELPKLVGAAIEGHGDNIDADGLAERIQDFMVDRLRAYFADQGVPATVFAAVQAREPNRPHDFARRIQAVNAFRELPEAQGLAAANKRIQNILRQVEDAVPPAFDDTLFQADAEWNLAAKLVGLGPRAREMLQAGDYTAALKALAGLRESVDDFFDTVKVMDDDEKVKNNRLALLNAISELFLHTADISRLQE